MVWDVSFISIKDKGLYPLLYRCGPSWIWNGMGVTVIRFTWLRASSWRHIILHAHAVIQSSAYTATTAVNTRTSPPHTLVATAPYWPRLLDHLSTPPSVPPSSLNPALLQQQPVGSWAMAILDLETQLAFVRLTPHPVAQSLELLLTTAGQYRSYHHNPVCLDT